MQLTEKQSKQFLKEYMTRYSNKGETSLETSERIISVGIASDPDKELDRFHEILGEILGKRAHLIYKYRKNHNTTYISKAVGSLRLNYGPKCVDSKGKTLKTNK